MREGKEGKEGKGRGAEESPGPSRDRVGNPTYMYIVTYRCDKRPLENSRIATSRTV